MDKHISSTRQHKTFEFIDLFAGIGGMRLAFEDAGGTCVFSSEINKFARETYEANFGDMPYGDITQIESDNIARHNVLVAGFPCQPFSIAGVSKHNSLGSEHGFAHETQGNMFFEIERVLNYHKPDAFLLENVKNLRSHDKGNTFRTILEVLTDPNGLNYRVFWDVLDGSHYVPQHRERTYIVGFKNHDVDFIFPDLASRKRRITLKYDVLESEPDPKYTLSHRLWEYLRQYAAKHRAKGNGFGFGLVDPNVNEITRTLSARYYKDGSEILIDTGGITPRRLTPRECCRLMGFPESYVIPVSDTQAYKQFGNSVIVPLVSELARNIASRL